MFVVFSSESCLYIKSYPGVMQEIAISELWISLDDAHPGWEYGVVWEAIVFCSGDDSQT